jgi:hypothetical protein
MRVLGGRSPGAHDLLAAVVRDAGLLKQLRRDAVGFIGY